jgi:hypothetical protein
LNIENIFIRISTKEGIKMSIDEIENVTSTVEDFIAECLNQDIEYEIIFEYIKTKHRD